MVMSEFVWEFLGQLGFEAGILYTIRPIDPGGYWGNTGFTITNEKNCLNTVPFPGIDQLFWPANVVES